MYLYPIGTYTYRIYTYAYQQSSLLKTVWISRTWKQKKTNKGNKSEGL